MGNSPWGRKESDATEVTWHVCTIVWKVYEAVLGMRFLTAHETEQSGTLKWCWEDVTGKRELALGQITCLCKQN